MTSKMLRPMYGSCGRLLRNSRTIIDTPTIKIYHRNYRITLGQSVVLKRPKPETLALSTRLQSVVNCRQFCTAKFPQAEDAKIANNENEVEDTDDLQKHELGQVKAAKMYLSFTCTVCNGPNEFMISKQAYVSGVVIVTCKTCKNHHLIADNLNWFEDVKGKNIEEIMAEKGERVMRFSSSEVNEIIPKED